MQAKVIAIIYASVGKDELHYTGVKVSVSGLIGAYKVCSEEALKVGQVLPLDLLEKFTPRA